MFPYKHIGTWNIFSYWINCTTLVGRLYRECSMEKLMEFLDAMERRDALKLIDSLCWLSSIFDVTAIVHLSHYTDALKLTIVFCLYVISPFRLLKNDSRKLSYFVLSFPFPKILPVSYTDLLIHYLFFSNKRPTSTMQYKWKFQRSLVKVLPEGFLRTPPCWKTKDW
jgi:hypothetical protein